MIEQNNENRAPEPVANADASGDGYWLHDGAGPARYVPAANSSDEVQMTGGQDRQMSVSQIQQALADHLGPDGAGVTADRTEAGLRLSGRSTTAVAGRAMVWAIRRGFDPVEDLIDRDIQEL